MAYWIDPNTTKSTKKSYMCDYRTDIDNLPKSNGIHGLQQDGDSISDNPTSFGSDCLCLEDSSVWILSKDTNTWIELD